MKPLKSWSSLPTMQWWRTDSATPGTITGCCLCSVWILPEVRHLETLNYRFCLRVWRIHSSSLVKFSTSNSGSEDQRKGMLKKFEHFQHLAELYHVYHSIQRFMVRTAAAVDSDFSRSEKSERICLNVERTLLSHDFKAILSPSSVPFSSQADFLINACF